MTRKQQQQQQRYRDHPHDGNEEEEDEYDQIELNNHDKFQDEIMIDSEYGDIIEKEELVTSIGGGKNTRRRQKQQGCSMLRLWLWFLCTTIILLSIGYAIYDYKHKSFRLWVMNITNKFNNNDDDNDNNINDITSSSSDTTKNTHNYDFDNTNNDNGGYLDLDTKYIMKKHNNEETLMFQPTLQPIQEKDWYKIDNNTCITSHANNHNNYNRNIPKFILLGVMKGGTTALSSYLYQHPNIYNTQSETHRKEVHFFDWKMDNIMLGNNNNGRFGASGSNRNERNNKNDKGMGIYQDYMQKQYLKQFVHYNNNHNDDDTNNKKAISYLKHSTNVNSLYYDDIMNNTKSRKNSIIFDDSPRYVTFTDRIPARIKCVVPYVNKFIILLRNPIDRAYSQFTMKRTGNNHDKQIFTSFEQYIMVDFKVMIQCGILVIKDENNNNENSNSNSDEQLSLTPINQDQNKKNNPFNIPKLNNYLDRYVVEDDPNKLKLAWKKYCRSGTYQPIGRSLYYIQIQQWYEYYNPDNFIIIQTEYMKNNTDEIYDDIIDFIDLPRHKLKNDNPKFTGKYDDFGPIHNKTRIILQNFFKPYNDKLFKMLGWKYNTINKKKHYEWS